MMTADKNNNFEIQQVIRTELPRVIAIARRTWPVAFDGILTPEQIASILENIYTREGLTREMKNGYRSWIAARDGHDLGFATGYAEDGILWLKRLYIDPSAQGSGIGRALTQTVIDAFPETSELRLLVNRENHAAMRFYERIGISCIGEVPVKMGKWDFIDMIYARQLQR